MMTSSPAKEGRVSTESWPLASVMLYLLAGAKKRGKMAKKGPMKKVVMDQGPPGPLILRGGRILAQNGSSSVSLTSSSSGASRSWLTRSATFNGKA